MSTLKDSTNISPTETKPTISYTRLSCYQECQTKYKYRYIVKPEGIHIPLEDYFLKGTLAHRCIEEFLKGAQRQTIVETVVPLWIKENCLLPVARDFDELERRIGIDTNSVIRYVTLYAKLLHRCSAIYKEADAIRNRDGSIPKDPVNYPPNELSSAYKAYGLGDLKMLIDNSAALLSNQFRRISLADTAAQGIMCFYNFELPDWVKDVTGIEYTSDEKIPWDDGKREWAWFVDLKYTTTEGAKVISDHKTSSSKPEGLDVAFHPQLNLYAYLEYEATGEWPDYLAINHLPSGDMVIAKTDPAVVQANVEHFQTVQQAINQSTDTDSFTKHQPTDFNSPCIKKDWKTKAVKQVCPYITLCHPRYVDYIKTEVADYLCLDD
jgi:hypothetical protein